MLNALFEPARPIQKFSEFRGLVAPRKGESARRNMSGVKAEGRGLFVATNGWVLGVAQIDSLVGIPESELLYTVEDPDRKTLTSLAKIKNPTEEDLLYSLDRYDPTLTPWGNFPDWRALTFPEWYAKAQVNVADLARLFRPTKKNQKTEKCSFDVECVGRVNVKHIDPHYKATERVEWVSPAGQSLPAYVNGSIYFSSARMNEIIAFLDKNATVEIRVGIAPHSGEVLALSPIVFVQTDLDGTEVRRAVLMPMRRD